MNYKNSERIFLKTCPHCESLMQVLEKNLDLRNQCPKCGKSSTMSNDKNPWPAYDNPDTKEEFAL